MDYFVLIDEKERGPYTEVQLRSMWLAGSLTGEMPYRQADSQEWSPLSDMRDQLESAAKIQAERITKTVQPETLGRPESAAEEPDRSLAWGWRWVVGLAAATAVVVIVAVSIFPHRSSDLVNVLPYAPNAPVIQLAMLNTVGGTRGMERNELATLQGTWKENPVRLFFSARELEAWEKNWPSGDGRPAAKIIYDPAAGEVRVSGRSRGKFFQKTFPVEKDMATTLQQVRLFIREQ